MKSLSEFYGKKYNVWSNINDDCGVWDNDTGTKVQITSWNGIYAPTFEHAKEMASELNSKYDQYGRKYV